MKLKVLMWKHMKARYRQYIKTITEILFPIILFSFAYAVTEIVYIKEKSDDYKMYHISTKHMNPPQQVLYYPPTVVTDKLMDFVGEKIKLRRLHTFPKYHSSGFYGIQNKSMFKVYPETIHNHKTAIVVFEGITSSYTFPSRLNYTIKVLDQPNKELFDDRIFTEEHVVTRSLDEPFVSLQWAIDMSYLNLQHGVDNFEELAFQEVGPFVERRNIKVHILLVMHIFSFISLGVIFMFHVARVMEERVSGVQALINMTGVSSALFNLCHLLNALLFGIIYTVGVLSFMVVSINKAPVLETSSLLLVALKVFMYYANIIMMGFFTCYLLSDTRHVMASAAAFYGLSYLPSLFLYKVKFKRPYLLITLGILPHVPMDWFWAHLAYLEAYGSGLNAQTMVEYNKANILKPYMAYVMTLVQFILFSMASYYISLVRPGKFRSGLPWDFMCYERYWFANKSTQQEKEILAELRGTSDKYLQYFEPRPPERHIGIRIVNVSKIFENSVAVEKITFNIHRGEITVLLGHNGAGKSTLMNIIAGMEKPTAGSVYVNGFDVNTHSSKVKNLIGVCPQQKILIPELTVIEHIMFFNMIRTNVGFIKARVEAAQTLKRLGLEHKAFRNLHEISQGAITRLQLGCAIAGGTNVLILDEPTSGLDVETRRGMWDLLLTLRGERTVLLTTHFMEEADALGDRVAALHVGRLRCYATPRFLKNAVGKGYRLTLMTIGSPNLPRIAEAVFKEISHASMKEATLNCVTFTLPTITKHKFPNLFDALEKRRDELRIQSICIGTITLEEAFLRLCSDVHVSFRKVDAEIDLTRQKTKKGLALSINQLLTLLHRQMQYYLSYKYSFLLLELIIPVFMLAILTYATNAPKSNRPSRRLTALPMDLTVYDDILNKKVLLNANNNALRSLRPKFKGTYRDVEFELVPNITKAALRSNDNIKHENILFGIDLNETKAKVVYLPSIHDSGPVAVNLLANMLAERSHPPANMPLIITYKEIIPTFESNMTMQLEKEKLKSRTDIFNWALFVSLVITGTVIHSVTLLSQERVSGTRHVFFMNGCSPLLYWMFTWLHHTVLYVVMLVLPAVIVTMMFEGDKTLDQVEFRAALLCTLIIGLMAYLSFMFLISLYCKENSAIIVCIVCVLVFGMITPTGQSILREDPYCCGFFFHFLEIFDYTIPQHTFTSNLLTAGRVARINALCKIVKRFCPLSKPDKSNVHLDVDYCCESSSAHVQCYFCLEKNGLGGRFIIGAVQSIFYMILVMLSQLGIFNLMWDRISNHGYRPGPASSYDSRVMKEMNYVHNAIHMPRHNADVSLVQNLHKRYVRCRNMHLAVNGVTFSVKKGECLGIVGLSGSGKTSLARMLIGAECASRGKILCHGVTAKVGKSKYLKYVGFCPQNHFLDDFRTADENLATLLKLRGFKSQDVKKGVENWIQIIALERHSSKRLWSLSNGCKRRAGVAAALMSGGALTVLDEPTAGIDVSARREVWAALSEGMRGGRAAIVTSNTMEEMEALCDRVCILVDGVITSIATPAQLRTTTDNKLLLQLILNTDEDITTAVALRSIDTDMRQTFSCKLTDGHKSMLQYTLVRDLTYSEIFTAVERLKERHPRVLLDYTVKEPMLEEVFLAFAKKKRKPSKNRRNSWFRYA